MGTYLIKASLIWFLFLLLFRLLYRKSDKFLLSRAFLFTGLLSGIILPLIPLSFSQVAYPAAAIKEFSNVLQNVRVADNSNAAATDWDVDWSRVLLFIYLAGTVVFLLLNIREVISIIRMAAYGSYEQKQGYRIFRTGITHAPFSFMGWIFITDPAHYERAELDYIIRHEAAHNQCKHWLDVLMLQLTLMVFWFHPLVWVYRYYLKQEHEYEADAIASEGQAYEYGHFLLRQVLLKGTPAIAHSFHFSPIKNRITMLTNDRKTNKWKYLAVLPALLCCGILIAKPASDTRRVKNGNVTIYKGNKFYWQDARTDSVLVEDMTTGERVWTFMRADASIIRVNKDSVQLANLEDFTSNGSGIKNYYTDEFRKRAGALPDSLEELQIKNLVISDAGRIIYYDAYWFSAGTYKEVTDPYFSDLINTITEKSPDWSFGQRPRTMVYVQVGFSIPLKPGIR